MRVQSSSALYRISRFHVGSSKRRRRLWTRYQAGPAVVSSYVLAVSFLMTVAFVASVELCRFFHAGLWQILAHAAGVLQHLNH